MAENTVSRRTIVIGIGVTVAFVAIVVGTVIWALGRSHAPTADPAATRAAFASAMRKAQVEATFPDGAPIALESVEPTGEHPFTATFTAEELSALLAAFSYTADLNGSSATVRDATVRLAGTGQLGLSGSVQLDTSTYSATMEGPIGYSMGLVSSPGPTQANVEGITLNADQRAQLTTAIVDYLNAYLAAAPGLRVGSVRITNDGVVVTGAAPDRLAYP